MSLKEYDWYLMTYGKMLKLMLRNGQQESPLLKKRIKTLKDKIVQAEQQIQKILMGRIEDKQNADMYDKIHFINNKTLIGKSYKCFGWWCG